MGFPKGHPRYKALRGMQKGKGKPYTHSYGQKWNKGRNGAGKNTANDQQGEWSSTASSGENITPQQLEQLLKLLPTPANTCDIEDEMDLISYSSMVLCHFAHFVMNESIIDS